MRIEVYIPPYLNEGRTQPNFTVAETEWNYGGSYDIEVNLHHGTTDTMRVSLIAGTWLRIHALLSFTNLFHSYLLHSWQRHGRPHIVPGVLLQR